jgi:hypothetical protein
MHDNVRKSTTMYDNIRQILEAFKMASATHEPYCDRLVGFLGKALATNLLERAYEESLEKLPNANQRAHTRAALEADDAK